MTKTLAIAQLFAFVISFPVFSYAHDSKKPSQKVLDLMVRPEITSEDRSFARIRPPSKKAEPLPESEEQQKIRADFLRRASHLDANDPMNPYFETRNYPLPGCTSNSCR